MTTFFPTSQVYSGSYNFAPTGGEIILSAFQRVRVRPTEITPSHLMTANMEMNLLQAKLAGLQPNLWTVDLQALPLVQGQGTYSLPAETAMITDAFVRTGTGTATNDRIIFPLSRAEYAAIANKETQQFPNQFWFDRLISPTITFYPIPDGTLAYTCYYYRVRLLQDAKVQNAVNMEVPVLWLDAVVSGLAHRLSRIYAPDLEQMRKMDADEAWRLAATQDTENVPMYIIPAISGYFR